MRALPAARPVHKQTVRAENMKQANARRRIRVWKIGTAMAFLFCICVCWLVFDSLFAPFSTQGERVEIPDYRGQRLDDLSFLEWMEVKTVYRHDDNTPSGVVVSQEPAGGSLRKISPWNPTCRLTVTVSLGKEHAALPNVVGKDVRVAEVALRELGFTVRVERSEGAYPEGQVFDMEPRAGAELPLGSTVTLSVSRGAPAVTVEVPDLRGLSRAEALMRLWEAQLSVGEVVEEPSFEQEGTVLRQSHLPGTLVTAGTKITLYISAPPASYKPQ